MANSRLRSIIIKHDIGEEEWQAGLDLLAKEYLKGEGELPQDSPLGDIRSWNLRFGLKRSITASTTGSIETSL
ncbi:hypothetical protein QFC24_003600 [Naganishia onofrii]|uniref:Uncharacterized protein n=1 Tax=Naganishia onofrii TaxID=1851511 RepID=A0ACC2XIZ2_9TREE|nr:hypothetical protein QFC24_003600 [Naganishia onofrii]